MFWYQSYKKQVTRHLLEASIADSTSVGYNRYFEYWKEFCDDEGLSYSFIDDEIAADFICWLWWIGMASGDEASKTLTSVTTLLLRHNCVYKRNKRISGMIKGFKKLRPPKRRYKKPWSLYHTQFMRKHCIDTGSVSAMALSSGVILGYYGFLRPGEYSKNGSKYVLKRKQVTFFPNLQKPKDVIITLTHSKTNQFGKRETISIPCLCHKKFVNEWVPCPVHHLKHYVSLRDNLFPKRENFLIKANGKDVSFTNMTKFIRKCIDDMNAHFYPKWKHKYGNYLMNLKDYTPHSLRIGGCTDLARSGEAAYFIEQQGRWSSKCWKTTYINLDWRDISLLSGVSINDLKHSVTAQPYIES